MLNDKLRFYNKNITIKGKIKAQLNKKTLK